MEIVNASALYALSIARPTCCTDINRSDTSAGCKSVKRGTTRRESTNTSTFCQIQLKGVVCRQGGLTTWKKRFEVYDGQRRLRRVKH